MTDKLTHTPGPWTIRDYKTKAGGIWIDGGFIRNRSCGTVGEIYPLTHQDGNVRLIAAAPDLLDVLRTAGDADSSDEDVRTTWWEARSAAIAKAEGRE